MALAVTLDAKTPPYPAHIVSTEMQTELLRAVRARFRRRGEPLPADDAALSALAIEIDSLTVVELLSTLDDILPFMVNESAVKPGGYPSIDSAVRDVTSRVERRWYQHHSGAKQ